MGARKVGSVSDMIGRGNEQVNEEADKQADLQRTFEEAMKLAKSQRDGERFSKHLEGNMKSGTLDYILQDLKNKGNPDQSIVLIKTEEKLSKVNDSVKTLLSTEISLGVPVMGTTEYQQLIDSITDIYNNVTIGVPEDITSYMTGTIYENDKVKILTIKDPMDSSKNVKITFNKWQNRFNVTKDGKFVTSKVYM